MALRYANFAQAQLAADIAPTDTLIRVRDSSRFPVLGPSDHMICVIFKADGSTNLPEVVRVTAVSSDTFTCERGQDGPAQAFSADDLIENRVTSELLDELKAWRRTVKPPVLISEDGYAALAAPDPFTLYCHPEEVE